MIIQLEFCGMTREMEVPEQVSGLVDIDWIPGTLLPLFEISNGKKSEIVERVRLIFKYGGNQTEQGYMIYNLSNIDKIL